MTSLSLAALLFAQLPFEVVANRGMRQTSPPGSAAEHACTGVRITPPMHPFIENTLPSIAAAFAAHATMVVVDFHRTSDGHLIAFHDWRLECRTDGEGVTREQPLAYLKSLDVGFGYTPDDGKTYPLRGSGVGLMPTLEEVLDAFPSRRLLLSQKDGDAQTARLLAQLLLKYPPRQRQQLYYWGPQHAYQALAELVPEVRKVAKTRDEMLACARRYFAYGWLGIFPEECRDAGLLLPYAERERLWGWPQRFLSRAHRHGSRVFVVYVNSAAEVESLWGTSIDGVVTDKIEVIGPLVRELTGETGGRARLD